MQVAFYFAGEITQVLDAIPWVRCASGNVFFDAFPDDDVDVVVGWSRRRLCADSGRVQQQPLHSWRFNDNQHN